MTIRHEQIPDAVLELCRRLETQGHHAWVVGGCVRDLMLGKAISDWDIATSAKPNQVKKTFRRVIPTGLQHGTVTVMMGKEAYEVTTLRGEGAYSDGRRPDEVFFVDDITEDLARRDFTVNAIAFDPITSRLVDPHGGARDLEKKLLRAVGDPKERFSEDGLRILRGARFCATLEFALESETEAAFHGALGTFKKVSPERVRAEWLKAMKAKRPSVAFEVMKDTGILGVTYPELLDQVGCEQNKWHEYDVWGHTMAVLDNSEGTPVERLAALLHDVGKPRSRQRSDKTNDYTFYNHERIGADMAEKWLRAYRFSNEERELVVHLVKHHLICYDASWTDATVRRFLRRVGPERVDSLLRLGRADVLGKGRPVENELADLAELRKRLDAVIAQGQALSVKDLPVRGPDVIARMSGAGPGVGALLRHLLEAVTEDPALNDRDKLLKMIDKLAPEFEARHPRKR